MSSDVYDAGRRGQEAARRLATATRAEKDAALAAMADAVTAASDAILSANAEDIARFHATSCTAEAATRAVQDVTAAGSAAAAGTAVGGAAVDRLRLDADRVQAMAQGLRDLAVLPDPVGDVVRGQRLPNGLEVRQVRVPLGVAAIIYEGRPNVTADAAGICVKSGNAVLLRGSSSARSSNATIVAALRAGLETAGLPPDAVQLVGGGRESVGELLRARGLVDVVIPRGGAGLIQRVVTESTVPVIETGVGNCHVYVDAAADLEMAERIVVNAKTQRPSVCNAAESLLVHAAVAEEFLPRVLKALSAEGVTVHGDERVRRADASVVPATDADFATEYLGLEMSAAVVESLDDAVAHIRRYGSGHTEAIVTDSQPAARRFTAGVDAAAVMVNASTRFTDGGEFGFGAEIGISTQKLHARGPMGLPEMTSTTWVVTGDGQIRA